MSLIDFFKNDLVASKNLKLTGNGYSITGYYFYADEEFVVLKDANGKLDGMRIGEVRLISSVEDAPERPENAKAAHGTAHPEQKEGGTWSPAGSAGYAGDNAKKKPAAGGFKEFKPGDRIPLEELVQRDPKVVKDWKRKEKDQALNNALVEKLKVVEKEVAEAGRPEDAYELLPYGKIIKLQPSFAYGFIKDNKDVNKSYFFNRSDMVDTELMSSSGEDIEVVYYRGQNKKGNAANVVMFPSSVTETLKIASRLLREGKSHPAEQVVSVILDLYPENASALAYRGIFEKKEASQLAVGQNPEEANEEAKYFLEGKRLMEQNDYRGAIQSFQTSIDNGYNRESSIKEMATAYLSLAKASEPEDQMKVAAEAKEFMDEYRSQLPDTLKTLFVLENFYFAIGYYSEHIDIVEEIIARCGQDGDMGQYTFYLNKAAQSYLRMGELDKALSAVSDGLEADPDHPLLKKTQIAINEALEGYGDYEDYEEEEEDVDEDEEVEVEEEEE